MASFTSPTQTVSPAQADVLQHTELRAMARLALALGHAAEDPSLCGHAQDGLMAAIAEGRVKVAELGATMASLLDTGFNKLARWAKALREVARVSAGHASAAVQLIELSLHGNPAPRDISTFLEALPELLSETGSKLGDPSACGYIAALTTGGKTAKLV